MQHEAKLLIELQERRKQFICELKAFCRGCKDENCPNDCEVKIAYSLLFK